jgi:two-component system chemotaxis response regulator CheY
MVNMMNSKNAKILVVDNSMFMRNTLRNILVNAGYNTIGEAQDGAEAIQKYKKLKPDVLITEIILPDIVMNGLETLKWIIKMDPQVKIIVISALKYTNLINELKHVGVNEIINKPFVPDTVIKAVDKVVRYDGTFWKTT